MRNVRVVVIGVFLLFVATVSCQQQKQCPANQEYNSCGTACPPTCANLKPEMCTMQCVQGCFCKAPLVKDSNGNCIDPKSCPRQTSTSTTRSTPPARTCPENQVYKECGTACPPTCANPKPEICTEQCVQGCYCEPNLAKDQYGKCVDPGSCSTSTTASTTRSPNSSQTCPPNQVYTKCGSACAPTCDNPRPEVCTMECVVGCVCKPELVKDSNGNCIDPKSCPRQTSTSTARSTPPARTCPANQEYQECGSACPRTCKDVRQQDGGARACPAMCVSGCFCKGDLVRDDRGNCVEPNSCPPQSSFPAPPCPGNQVYKECGTACPPTCANPKPEICTDQCVQGCFCEPNLVKDQYGKCVDPGRCSASTTASTTRSPNSSQTCPPNQEYTKCGSACAPTCDNLRPEVCTMQCVVGCVCQPGLVKARNGDCVKEEDCAYGNGTRSPLSTTTTPRPRRSTTTHQSCGKHEMWSDTDCVMPAFCQPRCSNLPAIACKLMCRPGGSCLCRKGFVRDAQQKCVNAKSCAKRPNGPSSSGPQ